MLQIGRGRKYFQVGGDPAASDLTRHYRLAALPLPSALKHSNPLSCRSKVCSVFSPIFIARATTDLTVGDYHSASMHAGLYCLLVFLSKALKECQNLIYLVGVAGGLE